MKVSVDRGLGRKLQRWASFLDGGKLRKSSRVMASVICPACETYVGVYRNRIVFHSLGNRRPNWIEVASEIGPLTKWCPGSDQPAPQLASDPA